MRSLRVVVPVVMFVLAAACGDTEHYRPGYESPYNYYGGTGGSGGGGFFNNGGGGGSGCFSSGTVDMTPIEAPTAEPLPVTGGTLTLYKKEPYAIVLDAEAPAVHFIHIGTVGVDAVQRDPAKDMIVRLEAGDWPFRPVEDSVGNVHVLLRAKGMVASFDPRLPTLVRRTPVCDQPRGIAFDAPNNLLHVACAEGSLVTLRADDGTIVERYRGPNDLRDVVLQGGRVFVTRLRSAAVFELLRQQGSETKALVEVTAPMPMTSRGLAPAVAWRTAAAPGGLVMVHQGTRTGTVNITCNGYGGSSFGGATGGGGGAGGGVGGSTSIVAPVLTYFSTEGQIATIAPKPSTCFSGVLPIDVALSADGHVAAVAEAGSRSVRLFYVPALATATGESCSSSPSMTVSGRPLGIAIAPDKRVFVHTDAPQLIQLGAYSVLEFLSHPTVQMEGSQFGIGLPYAVNKSTGHRLFHDMTQARIACASCHPEGQDDGVVWNFADIGPRRTQSLSGGIANTAPFHWDGDMTTFSTLMTEVMGKRMSGPTLDLPRQKTMLNWINSIPAARTKGTDAAAVTRGKALFDSSAVGCLNCHSGALFTNNGFANVGTGKTMQVPTLVGLGTRAPFMHNGCAANLTERFTKSMCGGGDMHGQTSTLTTAQLADLVAYLETL